MILIKYLNRKEDRGDLNKKESKVNLYSNTKSKSQHVGENQQKPGSFFKIVSIATNNVTFLTCHCSIIKIISMCQLEPRGSINNFGHLLRHTTSHYLSF